jgi:DNA-binding transcriptional LysR family regulator
VELRQLHYFVTLAEELHFGRAAAREHVVPSALSQQIQRLERELGVVLVERNTHHVRLTRPGSVLLTQARGVLGGVEQAVIAAQRADAAAAVTRVAIGDASLDSMPQVLRYVQYNNPELVIHRIEASVPEQYRMLHEARLDIGVGRATHAPAGVASEVFRHDPLGVLLSGTRCACSRAAGGRRPDGRRDRCLPGGQGSGPCPSEFGNGGSRPCARHAAVRNRAGEESQGETVVTANRHPAPASGSPWTAST